MKPNLTLGLSLLAGLLAACNALSKTSAAPSVEQMERAWRAHNITAYRIEVLAVRSVWHAQSHVITVRNGQVESATAACTPAPTEGGTCEVEEFNAEDYTVDGLFAKAYTQVQNQQKGWAAIAYDPRYGFPERIAYNHPEIVDEDWTWRVTAFETLP